jgi:hypothetical protein
MCKSIKPITSRRLRKQKWQWYITPMNKRRLAKNKNGRSTSRPSRKEKRQQYITPIAKRRMAKRKMAVVHHAHSEKKNGLGTSRHRL